MLLNSIMEYVCDKLFIYQCLVTVTTYAFIRTALFIRVRKRRHQLLKKYGIPGPEPRLLDGSLSLFRAKKTTYLVYLELQKKFGNVYSVYIGDDPHLIISDPEILREIFLERMSSFKERTLVFIESPLTASILFSGYDRWKFMRKTIAPTFSSFAMRGQASTSFIDEVVKMMLDYIDERLRSQEDNVADQSKLCSKRLTLDIQSLMKATALKLITGLAIDLPGVQVKENDYYVESLDEFLSQADSGVVIWAIRFPFLKRILEFLADHMEHGKTLSMIRKELNKKIDNQAIEFNSTKRGEVRSPSNNPQLIDTLIRLYYEKKLTRDEVIGNAEALLFAGYDTTSTTLSYIFWVLSKHQDIQEKLRSELIVYGVDSEYLLKVINETMRCYPTVLSFATRMATENVTLNSNLFLPKGVTVVYNSWLLHRNPELWPEPEKFDPERFRDGAQFHPCAFAPFGMGDRKCIGYSLAMLELKTVVCDLVCRYRLFLKAPEELVLHEYANVISKPSEKIILELERL